MRNDGTRTHADWSKRVGGTPRPTVNTHAPALIERPPRRTLIIGLAASVLLALLVNVLLIALIERLVTSTELSLQVPAPFEVVEFVRAPMPDPTDDVLPPSEPPEPQRPPEQPAAPDVSTAPRSQRPQPRLGPLPVPSLTLPGLSTGTPYLGEFATAPPPVPPPAAAPVEVDARPLVQSPPLYPPRARRAGVEGVVTVEFTIDAQGEVRDAVIVTADPPRIFDRAVLSAIARWRFEPARSEAPAAPRRARKTFHFRLKDG